jgi:hypothetical protein
MDTRSRNSQIESILVIIIIICFCVATAALISSGEKSFNRIISNKDQIENLRIAYSYINMRIRQNDASGRVLFIKGAVESEDAIVIYHTGEEEGLATYIYYKDGKLRECYTDINDAPSEDYSFDIITLGNFNMEYKEKDNMIRVWVINSKGLLTEKFIFLRSAGGGTA